MQSKIAAFLGGARPLIAPVLIATGLMLSSCGGGGGSPTPTPPSGGGGGGTPAPTISLTSGTSASVAENTQSAVYTATATASTGQAVSFSINGGPDANKLTLSGATLTFNAAPDFEKPADANQDDVYEITLRATAGTVSRDFSIRINVTNDKEGISVTRIATGFVDPVCVDFLNERPAPTAGPQGLIAVGERGGKIYQVDGATGEKTLLANVFEGRAPAEVIECKTFMRVRTYYYSGLYAAIRENDGRVWMQRFDKSGGLRETELLPTRTPKTTLKLLYGPNDQFYMAVGDTEGTNAQNSESPLGKVYWLEQWVNNGASVQPGYFIPHVIGDGVRDPAGGGPAGSGFLFVDRGGSVQHELGFFDAGARPLDFGWPAWEGTAPMVSNPPAAVTVPNLVYPYGTGPREGVGVVAGWVYAGPASALKGRYVFGDVDGTIWSVPLSVLANGLGHTVDDLENRTADFEPDAGTIDSPVGFATDDKNRFYILDSDGELFRVDGS